MTTISDQERMERIERHLRALEIMVINVTQVLSSAQAPQTQYFINQAGESWDQARDRIDARFPPPPWSDMNAKDISGREGFGLKKGDES